MCDVSLCVFFFFAFPYCVSGLVWYEIVLIPDLLHFFLTFRGNVISDVWDKRSYSLICF